MIKRERGEYCMNKYEEAWNRFFSVKRVAEELGCGETIIRRNVDCSRSVEKALAANRKKVIMVYAEPDAPAVYINGKVYSSVEVLSSIRVKCKVYVWRLPRAMKNGWVSAKGEVNRDKRGKLISIECGKITYVNFERYTSKAITADMLSKSIGVNYSTPIQAMIDYKDYWDNKLGKDMFSCRSFATVLDKLFWNTFSEDNKKTFSNSIRKAIPSPALYQHLLSHDFGGYIETNRTKELLHNVSCCDLSSAYAANLVNYPYPTTQFVKAKPTVENVMRLLNESKAIYISMTNGEVIPFIQPTIPFTTKYQLTDIIIRQLIRLDKFNPVDIDWIYVADYGMLHPHFTKKIKDLYSKKEELKATNVAASNLNKFMLQNIYGKSIQGIDLPDDYDQASMAIYHRFNNGRYMLPQFGVWTHDYTFAVLLNITRKMRDKGVEVIACDTDCIRFIDNENGDGMKIIEEYNSTITDTELGKFKLEGVRDKYIGRKTKCYAYSTDDGSVEVKAAGIDSLKLKAWKESKTSEEVFDIFENSQELNINGYSEVKMRSVMI